MKSKNLRQLDLPVLKPLEHVPKAQIVNAISLLPAIRNLPTLHSSVEFARKLSGLQDKQIYDQAGIDSGAFSRMTSGSAWYPQDERWMKILNILQTEIPVMWMVEALGYDWLSLRKHQSELEQELEAVRAENRQLKHDREVEQQAVARLIGGRK